MLVAAAAIVMTLGVGTSSTRIRGEPSQPSLTGTAQWAMPYLAFPDRGLRAVSPFPPRLRLHRPK